MAPLKQINIKHRKDGVQYMVIKTHQRLRRFSQGTAVSIDGKIFKQVNSKKTLGVI